MTDPLPSGRAPGARRLLLRLDRARLASAVRNPSPGAWVGMGLPLLLAVGALWAAGAAATPDAGRADGAAVLGLLVAAPVAFLAYGVLFRGADDGFLRRLGVPPGALYAERAGRLLVCALGVAALALVPFLSAGLTSARPPAVALGAATAAWGASAWALASAASAMASHRPGASWGVLSMGMWDRELAATVPLVYAPLAPLLAGFAAGAWVGAAPGSGVVRALGVAALSAALARLGERGYRRALPRFAPQAQEMTFVPPPAAGAGDLAVGRGLARLLPRRAAAVRARDAVVAGRRFAWATRVVWPVAVLAVIALARWGRLPTTRAWVGAAALAVWLVQAGAVVGLGRLEAQGRRWIDRAAGIPAGQRFLGRWMWGWGLSLWLGVPLALAWGWWAVGPGWPWLLVGAGTAGVAALASLAAAGRG